MTDDDRLDQALDQLHKEARTAPASLDRARAALLGELDRLGDTGAAGASVTAIKPRRTRRVVLPVAAAVAAVLAITTVVVQANSGGGPAGTDVAAPPQPEKRGVPGPLTVPSSPSSPLSASQVLYAAADRQERARDRPPAPGQYRYRSQYIWEEGKTDAGSRSGSSFLFGHRKQEWIPVDEHQDWLQRVEPVGEPVWLGGASAATVARPSSLRESHLVDRRAPCGNYFPDEKPKTCDNLEQDSAVFYAKLPRNPDELFATMKSFTNYGAPTPATTFRFGVDALTGGLMPADLRSDWYRALAKTPGLTVVDTAASLDGRTGIALGVGDERERVDLIIDPATGDLIGERTVAGPKPYESWIKPNTVTGYESVTTAVVDQLGKAPR